MRKPLGANREGGVGGRVKRRLPRDCLEEPAAQFPPNHLLAPSGLRITDLRPRQFDRESWASQNIKRADVPQKGTICRKS
ncbi:MAG: hypothetical protein HYW48_00580 [Deltaproteobacteria bacterium]|nr:hypothetical protein [Deltaproteobacteria bacterium]